MELKQSFEKLMMESIDMALATSVDDKPNVRVVTFAYSTDREGRLFFTTFRGNKKTLEFEKNSNVACMTLPAEQGDGEVRIFGTVKKSDISFDEVITMIAKKYPGDIDTIKKSADMIDVYEINFSQAYVTFGMAEAQVITF